jgi:malonate-semialdehyde dehydrogenase (acetylating)/methylmalonate-semialdehyde dehydrogenase
MVYLVPHFINGKHLIQNEGSGKDIYNPAQGKIIGRVNFATSDICEQAISGAKLAWESWSETAPMKRAKILFNFRELLEKNQNDIAKIVTREHGKSLDDARGSIARAIEVVEFHCGLVTQFQGTFSFNIANNIDTTTIRQPLGVCCGISPFNFPVMVPVWMMIPAIASGNCFIIKPSEQDPSAPIRLLELLLESGLPPGVVQCVQGGKETVDYLITHPDIKAVTAVASTPVAETIYKTATQHGKRSHTFGGAKNHCVVMPDADMAQSAKAIVGAAFGSAGERCMALSVVVVVGEQAAQQIVAELIALIRAIKVDAGDCDQCDMGPLISHAHKQNVTTMIAQGENEGANLAIDGRQFAHPHYSEGYFLGPTLFTGVSEEMEIYRKEIFGPVLCLLQVSSFEEALALVNRNPYGNGTAIFTRDGYVAREYSAKVDVGMVGINVPIPVPVATHPFGGWKLSSFGDTNMHGAESLHFYTKRKTITTRWIAGEITSNQFNMPTHS